MRLPWASTSTRRRTWPSTPTWTSWRCPFRRLAFGRSWRSKAIVASSTSSFGVARTKSFTPSAGWLLDRTFVPTSVISGTASLRTSVERRVRLPWASTSTRRRICPSSPFWTSWRWPFRRFAFGRSWRSKAVVSVSITSSGRASTVGATSFGSMLPTWWFSSAGASFLFNFSFMSAKACGVGISEANKVSACSINSALESFSRTDSSKPSNSSLAVW